MSKKIAFKDDKELEEASLKLLDYMKKHMPVCILCDTNRSTMLIAYCPRGEARTALIGICDKCKPESDEELAEKIIAKVKEKMESPEAEVLHLTKREFIN